MSSLLSRHQKFVSFLANAAKTAGTGNNIGGDEAPVKTVIIGGLSAVVLFFIGSYASGGVTIAQALFSSVIGTVWLGLAGLIVAQATGMTDISPMSGMALISVTLMMVLLDNNVAASMVVGVAVCVAIGQGADMMQDLKTGFMIGGRPVKQQVAQFAVLTWIGSTCSDWRFMSFGFRAKEEQVDSGKETISLLHKRVC